MGLYMFGYENHRRSNIARLRRFWEAIKLRLRAATPFYWITTARLRRFREIVTTWVSWKKPVQSQNEDGEQQDSDLERQRRLPVPNIAKGMALVMETSTEDLERNDEGAY